METTLFLFLLALESALMVYSLVTKSHQEKTRSIIRIAALIAFSALIAASVIQWGFRWYALAALLFVWTAFGAWTLLRRGEGTKAYRARGVVFRAIIGLLLVFLAMIPALLFPMNQPPDATGPYAVAVAEYTYTDESRVETYGDTGEAREVNVAFWYPENAEGVYPLVLFSHGSLGIITSNVSLYRELASHGYVVAALGHPYLSLWARDVDGRTTFLSMDFFDEVRQEDPRTDVQQSYAYYRKWMDVLMGDINFVLDTILEKAASGEPSVYRLVDDGKIGVTGHSLGGSAALGVGRRRDDIGAVIALESPLMADIEGVEDGKFVFTSDVYPVPVLNIYSDSSWEHLSEWTQYAANHALLSDDRATAFNVHISGLGHLALTDLSLSSPLLVRIADGGRPARAGVEGLKIINEVSLEFLDAYLKGRGEFAEVTDK